MTDLVSFVWDSNPIWNPYCPWYGMLDGTACEPIPLNGLDRTLTLALVPGADDEQILDAGVTERC